MADTVMTYKIYHPDGTTETLQFQNYGEHDFDFNELLHDMDSEDGHPKLMEFINDSKKWICCMKTDRGLDNGCGVLYWDPTHKCYCAEDSTDDLRYGWNVASNMDELMESIKLYEYDVKTGQIDGGFVDWLLNRPSVVSIAYPDLQYYNQDPYAGLLKSDVCSI